MKIIVTGAAGFIGSHLSERLLTEGHQVIGVDMFNKPEWNRFKQYNIEKLKGNPNFNLIEKNLLDMDLSNLVKGAEVIFHEAAIAGVRESWGDHFQQYTDLNIMATQRLLEVCKNMESGLKKFVYASSSSVYGGTSGPTGEDSPLRPISPYGVSKLAGEHLVRMYNVNYGLPTTSLRYFTVYGPRQRPDMAFHKFLNAIRMGQPIPVYGDGKQTRDYTYISDAVEANLRAMTLTEHGNVFNIGGTERASVLEVLDLVREISGRDALIQHFPKQPGDPLHTWADITQAQKTLSYNPKVRLRDGLQKEWEYILHVYGR